MNQIPEKINAYNIYNDNSKLIGVSEEVTLPDLESITETISGPGILGEIDSPTIGHFGSIELTIPFRSATEELYGLCVQNKPVSLTLRAAQQTIDPSTNEVSMIGVRVAVRGRCKSKTGGSMKAGQGLAGSITIECTYLLEEVNDTVMLELDKLNMKYAVNGVDLMEKVRALV